MKKRKIKKRNPMAHELIRNPLFRTKVEKDDTKYDRNKEKKTTVKESENVLLHTHD